MTKLDLKKSLKHLYQPSAKEVVEVDVSAMNFLMIDGEGAPDTQAFGQAVEALFAVAYTLKFMVKKSAMAIDYGVMPLEGLWWADDLSAFTATDKGSWKWTLLILQPDFMTAEMVDHAMADVAKKKNPSALSGLRFAPYAEGRSAQILHIGPFSAEGPTVARVHEFIERSGHHMTGKHHEIYLSDFRKADPQKLKTIIRQPFA